MNEFEVFKGRKNKKGKVYKVRNIGRGYYSQGNDLCELLINWLEKDAYMLVPNKDPNSNHDYIIYYEDLSQEELEPVGVGHLLSGKNFGLIKLEWDLFGDSHIYAAISDCMNLRAMQVAA